MWVVLVVVNTTSRITGRPKSPVPVLRGDDVFQICLREELERKSDFTPVPETYIRKCGSNGQIGSKDIQSKSTGKPWKALLSKQNWIYCSIFVQDSGLVENNEVCPVRGVREERLAEEREVLCVPDISVVDSSKHCNAEYIPYETVE
jgi:hypothetical protein